MPGAQIVSGLLDPAVAASGQPWMIASCAISTRSSSTVSSRASASASMTRRCTGSSPSSRQVTRRRVSGVPSPGLTSREQQPSRHGSLVGVELRGTARRPVASSRRPRLPRHRNPSRVRSVPRRRSQVSMRACAISGSEPDAAAASSRTVVGEAVLEPQADAGGRLLDGAAELGSPHRPDEHLVVADAPGQPRVVGALAVEVGPERHARSGPGWRPARPARRAPR